MAPGEAGISRSDRVLLAELRQDLTSFPGLAVRDGRDSVEIDPTGKAGFPIVIQLVERGCYVDFGGCAQEFDDVAAAADWVRRVVSSGCRLRIEMVGGVARTWTLEPRAVDGGPTLASGSDRLLDWFRALAGGRGVIYRAFPPLGASAARH